MEKLRSAGSEVLAPMMKAPKLVSEVMKMDVPAVFIADARRCCSGWPTSCTSVLSKAPVKTNTSSTPMPAGKYVGGK